MATVVVTGASQGIGEQVALAFAAEPDTRLVLMARNRAKLEDVAESSRRRGATVLVAPCDVTDYEAVASIADQVRETFGAADVLVNNAGSFAPGGVAETTPDVFRAQIEVNLTSAYLVTHALLPPMLAKGSGTIFFMGSVASIKGYPRGVSYGAAKHGLLGLARSLREEVMERGIRVTTLLPGATYTDSWSASGLPEPRFIPPEDVARVTVEIARLDPRTVVEEVLIRPQLGDI